MFAKEKPLPRAVLTPNPPSIKTPQNNPKQQQEGILLGGNTYWNPESLPNAHVAMVGASGSGKTQTLKALAYEAHRKYPQAQVVVTDFHGDRQIEGETCYPLHMASPYGINPLTLNLDPEGGGPCLQAIAVAATLKKVLQLGPNQEGTLLEILRDCYLKRGIIQEKEETWTLEPPNFQDLEEEVVQRSMKEMVDENIEELSRTINISDLPTISLNDRHTLNTSGVYFLLHNGKTTYIGSSKNLAGRLKGNHHILQFLSKKYPGEEVSVAWYEYTKSNEERLKLKNYLILLNLPPLNQTELKLECKDSQKLRLKLAATFQYGIFSRPQPKFENRLIRIDLSKLPPALQSIAAESLAKQLMDNHRILGEAPNKQPRSFLFIDEAKEMPKTQNNACDRIIADGRKYGLALVVASQSERHFSADVIGNSATKIILPVDQTEVKRISTKFRFKEERVAGLTPLTALCRFGKDASQVEIIPYYKRVQLCDEEELE